MPGRWGAERGPQAVGTARLGRGDLLLLYSDGVLERPGRALPESAAEPARVAADAAADREAVRHAAVELVTNVLDHAHLDSAEPHTLPLEAALSATGRLSVRVADRTLWCGGRCCSRRRERTRGWCCRWWVWSTPNVGPDLVEEGKG
ncbi:SpoIIE family protein phosphatase [Actinosynnema pretiosum subsp. pretiosum]|uniref:SpoIIE family protein phosphatase n=1 Tax=Actinosynnema pretiosum subsp. pretiosum TaxID=103721 RepID=A0AA45R4R6_9PSEU|nr:SpoIIE family protein phosphatase [Actinosynnema pretiosum subsp. pretiosum]